MDILSAIIMIAVWILIGSAAKKAKKNASDARRPKRTIAEQMENGTETKTAAGPARAAKAPYVKTPATKAAAANTATAKAAAAQDRTVQKREAAMKEAKARLEKTKGIYTPVTVPAAAPEGQSTKKTEEHGAHTVQPSFEPGAHAHEETSMTGFAECPPEKTPAKKAPASVPAAEPVPTPALSFAFTKEETLRAIIYSEILAKPKALR